MINNKFNKENGFEILCMIYNELSGQIIAAGN